MLPRSSYLSLFAAIVTTVSRTSAAPLDPNDILVSIGNSVAGSFVQYNSVLEYTPNGSFVQSIPFNYDGGSYPATEYLRDIVVDQNGLIDAYNGTFAPFLTRYSPSSTSFTHTTLDGWSTANNVTYGGIATFQNFIYATDMATAGTGASNGIVRFDTATNTAARYTPGTDFIDLNVGLDGQLYGLYPGGSPGGTNVNVYDPVTMQLIRTIVLPSSITFSDPLRSLAVNEAGELFVSGLNGTVYRFNSLGVLETSKSTGFANLTDIDIDSIGRLILGQEDGRVIIGDSSLTSFTSFLAINDSRATAWTVFVSFATPTPIPEPSAVALFATAAAVIALLQFAKRARFWTQLERR
jgi:hypothetical protein